jgi:hypothetical protein
MTSSKIVIKPGITIEVMLGNRNHPRGWRLRARFGYGRSYDYFRREIKELVIESNLGH